MSTLSSSVTSDTAHLTEFTVPFLFSVLQRNDKVIKHSTDDTTTTTSTSKNDINESQLKQIECHIVLILELWAAQTENDGRHSIFLDACVTSILQLDQSRNDHGSVRNRPRLKKRKRNEKGDNAENSASKKKKETKKNKKSQVSKIVVVTASNKDKEKVLLNHLVRLVSRAPFLLAIDTSLRDFLIGRCFNQKSHWERLPRVISYILDCFEVSNPYLLEKSLDEKPPVMVTAQRKKSGEKKLAIAKNKKKQRLVSLTTKKKRRGSHFHRNLQDISKLLDEKKAPLSASTTNKNKSNRIDNTTTTTTTTTDVASRHKRRKVNDQLHHVKTKNSLILTSNSGTSASLATTKSNNSSSKSNSNNNKTFIMTPQRSARSDNAVDNEIVVRETPIAGIAPQLLEIVAGETPTYVGTTPMSSDSFMSPPVLPSPPTTSTSVETDNHPPQPVKLFGTVKLPKRKETVSNNGRKKSSENDIGSRGKIKSYYGKNQSHEKSEGNCPSSVHMARAYLRRRTY